MRDEFAPARFQVVKHRCTARGRCGHCQDSRHQHRRDTETRGVDRDRRPAADQGHQHTGARRAERIGAAARGAEQRIRGLQFLGFDDLRDETHQRGLVKRQRHAVARHQHHHQRHVRVLGHECDRHRRLTAHREQIGRHHHAAPRHAVGHDATEQQHDELRRRLARNHHARVARRTGHVQHAERHRDRRHRRAEPRDQVCAEQLREVAVTQQFRGVAELRAAHRVLPRPVVRPRGIVDSVTSSTLRREVLPVPSDALRCARNTRPRSDTPSDPYRRNSSS